jgi:hypothetical protein
MKTSKLTGFAVACCVVLLGCADDPNSKQDDSNSSVTSGGYTGLGKFVGQSGVYGNGILPSGGATGSSSDSRTSSGGFAVNTNGGSGMGAAANIGGTLATSGGARASDTSTNGTVTQGGSAVGNNFGGAAAKGGAMSASSLPQGAASTVTVTIGGSSSTVTYTKGGAIGSGGIAASSGTNHTGGATAAGGTVGGASTFVWPGAYNPAGLPSNPSGKHNPGTNCMGSQCHASSQASRAFAFGGTVYQSDGTTPAANAQIAITFGSSTVTTYSATNGNFWMPLSNAPSINWATATVHLRDAKGEAAKPAGTTVDVGCNSCHTSNSRITAP